jgi:TnpA family transposase
MDELSRYIYGRVKSYKHPKSIFADIMDYLSSRKIVLPRYRTFVNIISQQIKRYKREIHRCLQKCLDDQTKSYLDQLINHDQPSEYTLRSLRRYNQSLRPGNIRENITDFNQIKSLYSLIAVPFQSLNLNHDGALYWTRYVERNKTAHLAQRTNDTRYVSLIAFIAYQYFRGHDILADILLHSVQSIKNLIQDTLKAQRADRYIKQNQLFFETVVQAKACLVDPLEQITDLAFDSAMDPEVCVAKIRDILSIQKQPFETYRAHLHTLEDKLDPVERDKVYYSILELKSRQLQNRVGGIVKTLQFTGNKELLRAITHLQNKEIIENSAPLGFLSDKEKEIVYPKKGQFNLSLYKAILYIKIAEALKSGALSLPRSYKYRSLNDCLISSDEWNIQRNDYIKQAELEEFTSIENVLLTGKIELSDAYLQVNQLIAQDKLAHLKLRSNGSFVLRTPKLEETSTYSVTRLLPQRKDISIQSVLAVIGQYTGFIQEFVHETPTMQLSLPNHNALFASIIAYGCNLGIPRMARITRGPSQSMLETIANQYLSLENIKNANDRVLKHIDKITKYFNKSNLCHTSSDGSKYTIDGDSLNANYSFKYHGSGHGVASYTFLNDRFAHFYATVISSSEREACYVLDGLMNNHIIKSDVHSTDSHGFTEAVFGLMSLMQITFAPRLKNLSQHTLYGFKSIKIEKAAAIKPKKSLNLELIKNNWEDILRFAATIKLKYASSSQLFKRLNSYSKQHVLYKALKEFGRLQKSLFILQYLQDVEFRRSIEKQLNRGENSNKFSKAIAFGNNQEVFFEEKSEQDIAENCRQLIKNTIILWNYLFLVKTLLLSDTGKSEYALKALQAGNVLAWRHILFHGEYDLTKEMTSDEFELIDPKIMTKISTRFWESPKPD